MGAGNVCLAIIRWLPVIFITAVVVWSYYAYVVQMCIFTVDNIAEKVLYLIFYHPFVVMFAWSYWKTIFTDVGTVPKEFYLSVSDVEQFEREENEEGKREILKRLARNLPVQCRTQSGAMRYCEKCKCIKPDRAHHCSVCGFCIQKMDHHCPWVNNCVSFTTYKFFVLFLGYALLYCLYVAATSLKFFIRFWTSNIRKGSGEFHVLFLFFAAVMFAISLISLFSYHMYLTTNIGGSDHELSNLHIVFVFFVAVMFSISLVSLLGYHIFLTCKNRSTLESFRAPVFRSGPDKDGFSLGCYGNFQEVFGDNKSYWFLPIFTSNGDGVNFPTRVAPTSSSYHSMETTTTTTNNTAQPSETSELSNKNNSAQNETTDATPTNNSQQNPNFGDGVSFPIRSVDEDYDSLLGQRQRWMEEGDNDGGGPVSGYDRQVLTEKM